MAKPRVKSGGGMAALLYVFKKGKEAGGLVKLAKRLRSRNACKTCALGMGGQRGGMVNEAGHFPEVCKKSMQAQAADMGGAITEEWFRQHSIKDMETLTPRECEYAGRLAFPVVAREGDTHFSRVSWDEALDLSGDALRRAGPEESFFYVSGRSSNEAAYLTQLVGRAFGTKNIHNCSYYCHSASGAALGSVYGSGTASVVLEDLTKADLAVVVGANPASNHPRMISQLVNLRRRGGKVIVINPLRELGLVSFRIPSDIRSFLFGSKISDLYLQPHLGSDVALLKAIALRLIERGERDDYFVRNHTSGFAEVEADLKGSDFNELVRECGVPADQIEEAVDLIAAGNRGIYLWAMGLTHHANGVDNIRALANVALLRGHLGRPGAGLLPIRGHSNVQGVGSVGVSPVLKTAFRKKLEEVYGITVSADAGQDTYSSMLAAKDGRIQASFVLGGNLWGSNPDLTFAGSALQNIPFTVFMSTKLNPGHVHGRGRTTVILPVLARDEETQATTQESMFNFVRLSEGGTPAVSGEMRSEVAIVSDLAERILPEGKFDWSVLRSHQRLREEIAKTVPGYEALADLEKSRDEFQIEGRTLHEPKFATKDGRAHFFVTPLPEPIIKAEGDEFRLMTIRSEGQFNTVVYEEEDLYRGNTTRDVVMLSQEDADRMSLAEGDGVLVRTSVGEMRVKASIVDIRPGNLAMYYPEANQIVPRRLDPVSKTPAFKGVAAKLQPV